MNCRIALCHLIGSISSLIAAMSFAQPAGGSALPPANGTIPLLGQTEFTIRANPAGIARGPEGGIWYTAYGLFQLGHGAFVGWFGRFDPVTTETAEWTLGTDVRLWGIASAGGRMWFGEADGTASFQPESGFLDSFIPTPAGPENPTRTSVGPSSPFDLTEGPDGLLWYSKYGLYFDKNPHERGPSGIDRVLGNGSILPVTNHEAAHVAWGPDGNLWFTIASSPVGLFADRIARLTPAGALDEFPLPNAGSQPNGITAGADGSLWFTESGASRVGRISTAGAITEYEIPSGGTGKAIASAPDGSIWFRKSDSLVRILPAATPDRLPSFQEFPALRLRGGETLLIDPDGSLWYGAGGNPNMPELRYGALVHVVPQACPEGDLCLAGRFRIHLDWLAEGANRSSPGVPIGLTAAFGYFWFFSPNNVEVAVKVVDGRAVDGHFWVFAASLTNVEFTMTVTDTVTGASQIYVNPAGQLASFADTTTFAGEGILP